MNTDDVGLHILVFSRHILSEQRKPVKNTFSVTQIAASASQQGEPAETAVHT